MKPSYRLQVNGQNITPKINGRLINLTLTDERADKADQLDITLSDHDGQLAIPPRNATIEVWIGWEDALTYKGSFTLDEVTHQGPPDTLVLRARSVDFKGSLKRKREQSYHAVTLGDVLATLADRNGLEQAFDPKLAATPIEHLDQTGESDISLIRRLAEKYDAIGTVKNSRLIFSPAGTGTTASGQAIPAVTIRRKHCKSHNYQLSNREHDYTGVQTNWQNTATGGQETVTVGSPDNPKVMRHPHPTEANAQKAARAEWQRMSRAGAKLTLELAKGRAELYPDTPVKAVGFKGQIDATDWMLVRVVHSVGDSGFSTRGELEVKIT